jgi:GxxExxY protein
MSIFYDYPSRISELNALTETVIGSAIEVHKALGPGLLESAYEACLLFELRKSRILVESQVVMPIFYDGHIIDNGYRIDMLIEHRLIVELKSIERLLPIHQAQLMSYMKLGGKEIGLWC